MSTDIKKGKGSGYKDKNNKVCMIRCFKCGQENYGMNVPSGYCTWCGYNPNNKQIKRQVTVYEDVPYANESKEMTDE